jgi:hypothetical protein
MVWSQSRQIVLETLSWKKNPFTKMSWWSSSRCTPWAQAPVQKKKMGFFLMPKAFFTFLRKERDIYEEWVQSFLGKCMVFLPFH